MKKQFLILLVVLLSFQVYSQKKGSSSVFEAEITYNDGTVSKGLLDGFIVSKSLISTKGDPFKNLEKNFNLFDRSFKFKDASGNSTKIKSQEIKNVKLFKENGEYIEFGRFAVKHLNKKGELEESTSFMWLPYFVKDRISILGFCVFTGEPNQFLGAPIFFNREGEDFVIDPYNLKALDMFRFRKKYHEIFAAFKEIFKDCPETVALLDSMASEGGYDRSANRAAGKKVMKEMKSFEKSIKKLPEDEQSEKRADFYAKYSYEPFLVYIENYNSNCPEN